MADDLIPDPVNPGPTPVVVGSMTPTATISGTPTVGALAAMASSTGVTSGDLSGDVTTAGTLATMLSASAGSRLVETIDVSAGGTVTLGSANTHLLTSTSSAVTALSWTASSPKVGDRVVLLMSGTGVMTVAHGSPILNLATSAATPIATHGSGQWLWQGTGWVLVSHEQGAWISTPFNASAFTGASPLTWTVTAGNVTRCAYRLRGRDVMLSLYLASTTLGGSAGNFLYVNNAVWGGFTAVGGDSVPLLLSDSSGFVSAPLCYTQSSTPTSVVLYAVNRPFALGACGVNAQLTFEVT
jgi:hypothetical protein